MMPQYRPAFGPATAAMGQPSRVAAVPAEKRILVTSVRYGRGVNFLTDRTPAYCPCFARLGVIKWHSHKARSLRAGINGDFAHDMRARFLNA